MTVSKRLLLAFAAVIFVFLAVGGTSLFSSLRLGEADRWNRHTYAVIDQGSALMQAMTDMETGARGYLIAGEEAFLGPWTSGQAAFDKAWAEAKSLTADNPAQQQRLDGIKASRDEFVAVANALIQARRQLASSGGSVEALTAEFKQGKDKAAMDRLRALQAEFEQAEAGLLATRTADANALRTFNRIVIVAGSLFAVLVFLLAS